MHVNFAETEKLINGDTPLTLCYHLGKTHRSYGWAKKIAGQWTSAQIAEYLRGFERGQETSEPPTIFLDTANVKA